MSNQYRNIGTALGLVINYSSQDNKSKSEMAERRSGLIHDLEHIMHQAKCGGNQMPGIDPDDRIRTIRMEFGYDDNGDMAALQLTNAKIANFRGNAAPIIQSEVAAKLKTLYANVVDEEIPARFLNLLNQIPMQSFS